VLTYVPGVIWGASFLFIANGLEILPPAGVTFVRIALGFLTLGLFPASRRPVERRDWLAIAALGLTWFAFPLSVFPLAERYVSTALTGLLNGAMPVFAVLVATLVSRRMPGWSVPAALAVGAIGLALMAGPSLSQGENELGSTLLILGALASYGIAINIARPLQQRNGALPVIWRALGVALVLTAPWGVPAVGQFHWQTGPVLSMLSLGILGTALANVMSATAAGKVGAAGASASTFIIPIISVILGVVVRNETVPLMAIAGGLLCLVGAWLLGSARARESAAPRKLVAAPPVYAGVQSPSGR
jgi:drug/metabolite transporter (DMT)-like permease